VSALSAITFKGEPGKLDIN